MASNIKRLRPVCFFECVVCRLCLSFAADELALVNAAAEQGYVFVKRGMNSVEVRIHDEKVNSRLH